MTMRGQPSLFDLIHDTPFDPSLWTTVMARLCDVTGSVSAVLTELDILSGTGALRPTRQHPAVVDEYLAHWATRNPLHHVDDPIAYVQGWRPRIVRDSDWMDRDVLRRTSYFNEFLHPIGAEQSIFVRLGLEGTVVSSISLARPEHRGPFDAGEVKAAARYHAALVRAMRTTRRLRLAQDALDDLDVMLATTEQALIFLDRQGRVRRVSAAAERRLLSGGVLTLADGRLTAAVAVDDAALQLLLGEAVAGGCDRVVVTGAPGAASRFRLSATPLGPRSLAALSDERFILLTATEQADAPSPAPSRELDLRRRFALTAAEARVTSAIADGLSLRDAADRLGVSIHTIRAQLGAVFGKTSTRRQADLVRLALGATERD